MKKIEIERTNEFKSILEEIKEGKLGKDGFYTDIWFDGESTELIALRDSETNEQLFTIEYKSVKELERQLRSTKDFWYLLKLIEKKGFKIEEMDSRSSEEIIRNY